MGLCNPKNHAMIATESKMSSTSKRILTIGGDKNGLYDNISWKKCFI